MSEKRKRKIIVRDNLDIKSQNSNAPQPQNKSTFLKFINNNNGQLIILFLLTLLIYGNTLTGEYVLDDGMMIKENTFTKKGFQGIGDIFLHDAFTGISGSSDNNLYTGSRYRPLSQVVFAIVYAVFGLNPFIGHLINIICYMLIGLILLKILNIVFEEKKTYAKYFNLPFVITLLYLLHPIHTEVVANIKSLDEILGMLFSLLALYTALLYHRNTNKVHLFFTGFFILAGVLAKENAITFCAVIPLTIFLISNEWKKTLIPIGIALFLGALVYVGIRIAALGVQVKSVESTLLFHNPFLYASVSEKYATIMLTWLKYLQLLIFPHPLTHDYYPKQIPIVGWLNFKVLFSVLIYASFILFAIWNIFKKNIYAYAILFFLITFSVTSNLIFNLGLFMNERFMFMPSLGFAIVLGYAMYHLIIEFKFIEKAVLAFLVIVIIAYSIKTIHRNNAWLTGYGLFMTDVRTSTESGRCNVIVGSLLLEKARKDSLNNANLLNQCEYYLKRGLDIWNGNLQGWGMLGETYIRMGKSIEARECYKRFLKEQPKDNIALNNLSFIASNFIKQKKYHDAYETINIMVEQNPSNQDYQMLIIEALVNELKIDSALNLMINFVNKYPKSYKVYNKIGELHGKYKNDLRNAIINFQKAVEINPNYALAYENLGIVYGMKSQYQNSVDYFKKAIALEPKNSNLYTNLAITYQNLNQKEKADSCISIAKILKEN